MGRAGNGRQGRPVATRQFSIRTEPHTAKIGNDLELHFLPEVMGDAFLDGYDHLRQVQTQLGSNQTDANPAELRKVTAALREFLSSLMLPESAERFTTVMLPHRTLVELVEWVTELYGEGTTGRPTGSSNASAPASPSPGTRGSASSPSKASTRTRGR